MRRRKANEDIWEEEVMLEKWNNEQVKKKMWWIKGMWEWRGKEKGHSKKGEEGQQKVEEEEIEEEEGIGENKETRNVKEENR